MCAIDRASKVDLEEAYACGVKATRLAEEGISGVMVSIIRTNSSPYQIKLSTVPLEDVTLKVRSMDDKYINPQGNFASSEYLDYLKPLVGDLPDYSELSYLKYQQ